MDYGLVPENARTIEYGCPHCGVVAALPVRGVAIAQLGNGGMVFDGPGAMPGKIRCRSCRHVFQDDEG